MPRKAIPEKVQTEIMVRSRRRCAMCYGLKRNLDIHSGQIAHIDHNNENSSIDNLVFLCLEHHDKYDSKTSQSKNFTPGEITVYRDELYKKIESEFHISDAFLSNASYEPDMYNGIYRYHTEIKEATIEIKHIEDNSYSINCTSFYGIQRECGPNIGELAEVGFLTNGTLTYTNYDSENELEYSIQIQFIDGGIQVSEKFGTEGPYYRFGLGANFSGRYEKIE